MLRAQQYKVRKIDDMRHTHNDKSVNVGEYSDSGKLTLDKYSGNRYNSCVIILKDIIKDAWDHTRGHVQWRAGYTNDPLDVNLENCMWIKKR